MSDTYRDPAEMPKKKQDWFERWGMRLIGLIFVFGMGSGIVRWTHDELECPSPPECPPAPVCPGPTTLSQTCDNVCRILNMQQVSHSRFQRDERGSYLCGCMSATRSCTWYENGHVDCGSIFTGETTHAPAQ